MKQGQEKTLKRWNMLLVLSVMASSLLLSCMLVQPTSAPERPFATQDLLITVEDMPQGWNVVVEPEKARDEININEGFWIFFEAKSATTEYRRASHSVFRYNNAQEATDIYEEFVLPAHFGAPPADWTYRSSQANRYHFTCYDYGGKTPPLCEWTGVYREYIVIFRATLIPELMTLNDIKHVLHIIDTRMMQQLGNSDEIDK